MSGSCRSLSETHCPLRVLRGALIALRPALEDDRVLEEASGSASTANPDAAVLAVECLDPSPIAKLFGSWEASGLRSRSSKGVGLPSTSGLRFGADQDAMEQPFNVARCGSPAAFPDFSRAGRTLQRRQRQAEGTSPYAISQGAKQGALRPFLRRPLSLFCCL
eukprot:scaffold1006_cov270-Pinguiococcus_pyrenoidosus.AAC.7